MAEYRNSKTEEAAKLSDQATEFFEEGTRDRKPSDDYVRVTVTLATVLLLMAISQRFKIRGVRLGLLMIALHPNFGRRNDARPLVVDLRKRP